MLPLFITLQTIFGDAKSRLSGEEKGATAVEYGLLIGMVAIVLVIALATLGPVINDLVADIRLQMGL